MNALQPVENHANCEQCGTRLEIVPPGQWRFERYATCPRCGHATPRAAIVRQLRNNRQLKTSEA